jgi:hypothetical protein
MLLRTIALFVVVPIAVTSFTPLIVGPFIHRLSASTPKGPRTLFSHRKEAERDVEDSAAAPPEINNLGEWIEARKQWEIENVQYNPTVGASTRQELLGYAGFALASFVSGLAIRTRNMKVDQERGIYTK